jgi:uncharacterized protein (DUF433 family)
MQLEDYFDFLAPNDIRIKGHRVGIETILYDYIHRKRTPEEIQSDYGTLSLEQVYATILYYLHDKEAVGKYLADWMEFCRRSREESMKQHLEWYEKLRQVKEEFRSRQRQQAAP